MMQKLRDGARGCILQGLDAWLMVIAMTSDEAEADLGGSP